MNAIRARIEMIAKEVENDDAGDGDEEADAS